MATETPWEGDTANVVSMQLWKGQLRYKGGNSAGEMEPKAFINFRLNLTHHGAMLGKVRLNRFTGEIEVGKTPWRDDHATRPLADGDIVRAREWLQGLGLSPTKEEAHAALCEAAEAAAYDPLVDYLTGLVWDGQARLDRWLVDLFGVKDTPYARSVGSKWLIGAAARAMRPGCKVDYMLVLEGEQDLGKSTALRILAGDDWFTEWIGDLRDEKRFVEKIQGKWIIEFAELAAMGKSDIETVKAIITMQVDRARLSYARTTGNFPRRCVLAASVNIKPGAGYLSDPTGNKRFWPVYCTAINFARLRADRDQLWAEAAYRYQAGERWWLEGEERQDAVAQQQKRVGVHPWDEWVVQTPRLDEQDHWSSVEILSLLGMPVERQDQRAKNQIAASLTAGGWFNKGVKVNGKTQRRWFRKDCNSDEV